MQALHRIWTIARYETKTLSRSWFFRIFTVMSLLLILLIDYALFANTGMSWSIRCLPAAMPYMSMVMINMAQAVVVIFIASEFLKLDRKLNSTDTIYARSMTNYEYVYGKTLGVFLLFFGINLLVLVGALIMQFFFSDVPVDWTAYITYPFIISAPTLLYILGLSFFAMTVFQNQAVTFIILLAYIAGTLFYFGNHFYYLFDYMSFNLPLMSSGFVGFGGLEPILLHRGMYLGLGLASISFTALMLKRLPQSRIGNRVITVVTVAMLAGSIFAGVRTVTAINGGIALRERMNELNWELADDPRISVSATDLDIVHEGSTLSGTAALTVVNRTDNPIDRFLFNLNPGFELTDATVGGSATTAERDLHMITVSPAMPLAPGDSTVVTLSYAGTFNPEATYTDVDEEERATVNNFILFKIAKRYGFLTSDYVLLTPECGWYPAAGVPAGAVFPNPGGTDFTRFSLSVKTTPGLTLVAQGGAVEAADGTASVATELPIVGLTLAIGDYEVKSLQVDDVEYSVIVKRGHDYFSEHFTGLEEGIIELIREQRIQIEAQNLMTYPYPRFTLIETPVQFYAYDRPWKTNRATVQPEMMLMPEKGFYLSSADFSDTMMMGGRGMGGRGGFDMDPEQMTIMRLQMFISSTLTSDSGNRMMGMVRRAGGEAGISIGFMVNALMPSYTPGYTLIPYTYGFITGITSDTYPVFNTITEFYTRDGLATSTMNFRGMMGSMEGMSIEELACLELEDNSFESLLAGHPDKDILTAVLQLKGFALFGSIAEQAGAEEFDAFLTQFIESHRFETVTLDDFCMELASNYDIDCTALIDPWYRTNGLAEFAFTDMSMTQMIEDETTVYQLSATIINTRPVPGIVQIDASAMGGFGGGGGGFGGFGGGMSMESTTESRFISLDANQSKKVGIIYDFQPQRIEFNTIVSRNLPLQFDQIFETIEIDEEGIPFDGELVLAEPPSLTEPGITIVDNEDPGFQIVAQPEENPVRRFILGEQETAQYVGMNPFRPSDTWVGIIDDQLYGLRKTGIYKRSGDGSLSIKWTADITETGNYDVYAHSPNLLGMGGFGGGFGGPPGGGRGGGRGRNRYEEALLDLQYLIHHDDGVDELTIDPNTAEDGWVFIGTFYLSEGQAVVEMTDKSEGQIVYGDAIKWVKK